MIKIWKFLKIWVFQQPKLELIFKKPHIPPMKIQKKFPNEWNEEFSLSWVVHSTLLLQFNICIAMKFKIWNFTRRWSEWDVPSLGSKCWKMSSWLKIPFKQWTTLQVLVGPWRPLISWEGALYQTIYNQFSNSLAMSR
jgi:hypothetical protein